MPKSAQYTIRWSPEHADYLLLGPKMEKMARFSPQWLEEHHAFAFHGRNGRVNLLKEKRKRGSEGYWYAYRRHRGRMSKRYLGRDAQISFARLEEIALLLERDAEHASTHDPVSPQSPKMSPDLSMDAPGLRRGSARADDHDAFVPGNSIMQPGAPIVAPENALTPALFFEPLLISKLQVPRLQKGLLAREHLLAMLDQGLERKVTLIDAPAGYGKTTLIAQWIASREPRATFPRVASVTLDHNDNDPLRFWRSIIAACQTFAPHIGQEALTLLLASRLPPLQYKPLEMMLISLLNDLSQLQERGILLLDDLHVIQASQVLEAFTFFLEHVPPTLHLILSMRGEPSFSVVRLRAHNELLDVSPASLSFSLEETRDFLARELPLTLAPRIVRELHQRLEGWPAGLRLFSSLLSRSESEQQIEHLLASFVGSHWSLRAYFLSEVLHSLPEEQQEFLLESSVLPRIGAALCDALLKRSDSALVIETLRSGDFFLIPLDAQGEWLRYHGLFAETMQQEARRRLGDARLNQLALQASAWYEEHGLLAEAIETSLNAAAFPRASSLLARFIAEKYQNNAFIFLELYNLKHWLESLPVDELECHPTFCLHYAMLLLFTQAERPRVVHERERIYQLLQLAEQQWRDANDTVHLGAVFAFRALLARQEGRTLQALTWAEQALAWLSPADLIWRTIALTVVGIGAILVGTLTQAREALLEARVLNERLGNAVYARAARGMLIWVYIEEGELRYAAEQLRQMQDEARTQEDRDDIARTQLALAVLFYQWDRLDEAEQAAREAQRLGEQISEDEILYASAQRLARIEQARGLSEQAQRRLTEWLAGHQVALSPQSYQAYREIQATLASIQLANGDLVAVERWHKSLDQRAEILPLYQRRREQLLSARFLLAQGRTEAALEIVEQLLSATQQSGHRGFLLDIQIVRILIYARQGEAQRSIARAQLSEVLLVARSEGYLRLFLDEGQMLADLLRELLSHARAPMLATYVRDILAHFCGDNQQLAVETADPGALLSTLSPQEQKVLRLLVVGHSNAAIARELIVSVNTVRSQVQSIYRKLNVNNRVQASALASQLL